MLHARRYASHIDLDAITTHALVGRQPVQQRAIGAAQIKHIAVGRNPVGHIAQIGAQVFVLVFFDSRMVNGAHALISAATRFRYARMMLI